jgi:hypothetical protein
MYAKGSLEVNNVEDTNVEAKDHYEKKSAETMSNVSCGYFMFQLEHILN